MIRLDNLTLGYQRHPAIHHLTGSIADGAMLAVVGPNGAGKSTLLKGLAGLLRPLEGRCERDSASAKAPAYLPQRAELDPTFPISVQDMVCLGLWPRLGAIRGVDATARAEISRALAAVGLEGFEDRMIGSLSGGQMQRALFARLLVQEADLLLLDEPFTAIDARTAEDLLALIQHWHQEGRTIIAVLHDLDLVRRSFPESLLLAREVVGWGRTEEVLSSANLAKARLLCEAWDDKASICRRG